MCDSFVVLGSSTADGRTIFGKNSDREPNEPQSIHFFPRLSGNGTDLFTTTQRVSQVSETNAILISKPSWMWGGEMGVNDKGVVIGNEAVFTKETVRRDGLLGMDILRIALERSESAEHAVKTIVELIEDYGQGANGGFTKYLYYHNSFLIADRENAWVLETSNSYWVSKKVKGSAAISNCLTLGDDFDDGHPQVIRNAENHGWHKPGKAFSFAESYEKKLIRKFSGAGTRLRRMQELLEEGEVSIERSFEILRDHENSKHLGSMRNICMHAGASLVSSQTTSSMVVVLGEKPEIWITNSSVPCLSVFKPVWFDSYESSLPFDEPEDGINYWGSWEKFIRLAILRDSKAKELWREYCLQFEQDLLLTAGKMKADDLSEQAFDKSRNIARKMTSLLEEEEVEAGFFNRKYWNRQNKKLQELKSRNFKKEIPT
ncbi:carcinine hydrolase/isopenicillin-N N-acyltransferase family protein [Mesotoga sp.]|uniref:carcinine hydrolase/isopenicillin-N N-acyltransferase family protein n=1 Tax=Mesotoga sp. TaxID=2053577 RepID=UPI001BD387FC|nr:carcinine hydrolase/isopenicillin-N N-acyltransferase family protein [Mesotoga sp.]